MTTQPENKSFAKICLGCQETKNLDQFYQQKRGNLGRSARCKDCLKTLEKTVYYVNKKARRAANPALRNQYLTKMNERRKKRYTTNPEFRQSQLDSSKQQTAARKQRRAVDPEYDQKCRDDDKRYHKTYKAKKKGAKNGD